MSIDPNRQYRTRDGRAVRIYAIDGIGREGYHRVVHGAVWDGGWVVHVWSYCGTCEEPSRNLVEVTLADELREQVPWSALRPEVRWVALDCGSHWHGFVLPDGDAPVPKTAGQYWMRPCTGVKWPLGALAMPSVDHARWRETLIERPEAT